MCSQTEEAVAGHTESALGGKAQVDQSKYQSVETLNAMSKVVTVSCGQGECGYSATRGPAQLSVPLQQTS